MPIHQALQLSEGEAQGVRGPASEPHGSRRLRFLRRLSAELTRLRGVVGDIDVPSLNCAAQISRSWSTGIAKPAAG